MTRRRILAWISTVLATLPVVGRLFASAHASRCPNRKIPEGTTIGGATWDVVLTDAEIAALAAGVSPLRIRPKHLKEYCPPPGSTAMI